MSALATLVTIALMWRSGLWLLLAVAPYTCSYLFYRGSVVIAAEYGTALSTVLDLNRFELYRRLHLAFPRDSEHERVRNEEVVQLLQHVHERVPFEHDTEVSDLTVHLTQPHRRSRSRVVAGRRNSIRR